jgi:hypothetical protein
LGWSADVAQAVKKLQEKISRIDRILQIPDRAQAGRPREEVT